MAVEVTVLQLVGPHPDSLVPWGTMEHKVEHRIQMGEVEVVLWQVEVLKLVVPGRALLLMVKNSLLVVVEAEVVRQDQLEVVALVAVEMAQQQTILQDLLQLIIQVEEVGAELITAMVDRVQMEFALL